MYTYIFFVLSFCVLWSFEGPPSVTEKYDGLDHSSTPRFQTLSRDNSNCVRIKLIDADDTREYQVDLTSVLHYRHYLHGEILQNRGLLPDPKTFDQQTILVALENAIWAQRYMTVRHLVPHAYRIDRSHEFRAALKGLLQHYADEGHAICALEYARVRLRDINRTKPPYVQKDGLLRVPTQFACVLYDHRKYLALGLVALWVNALQCFHPGAVPPITQLQPPPSPLRTPCVDWIDDYYKAYPPSRRWAMLDESVPAHFRTSVENTAPLEALEHIQALCQEVLEGTKTLPSPKWIHMENPNLPNDYGGPFTSAHYAALLQLIERSKFETIGSVP